MLDLITGLLGLIGFGIVAFLAGKRQERRDTATETRNRRVATQERMNDAFNDLDSSPDAARSRLRDRAGR